MESKAKARYTKSYNGYPTTDGSADPSDGMFMSKKKKKSWADSSQLEKQGIVDQYVEHQKKAKSNAARRKYYAANKDKQKKSVAGTSGPQKSAVETLISDFAKTSIGRHEESDRHIAANRADIQQFVAASSARHEESDRQHADTQQLLTASHDLHQKSAARHDQSDELHGRSDRRHTITEKAVLNLRADQLTRDILSKISHVEHVGGEISPDLIDFFNYQPTLGLYVEGYLERHKTNPKLKLWISLSSEALNKQDEGHVKIINRFDSIALPIICAIESEVAPACHLCNFSLQINQKEFRSFSSTGLAWASMSKKQGVHLLERREDKSTDDDYNILFLMKPSMIQSLVPEPVEQVEFEYKGIYIVTSGRDDIHLAIEDNEELNEATDFVPILELARKAKALRQDENAARTEAEKQVYADMIESLAAVTQREVQSVKTSLEDMQVFKIYPEYEDETLPPPRTYPSFMGPQVKGAVKNTMLNRLYGNVDEDKVY